MTYGSPIGNPPPLSDCFLPPNLPSANILPELFDKELLAEVSAHCMSGYFYSSSVGLVEKVPGDGVWRMIRHLSKLDEAGHSMNGLIDSDEFPTTYFTALWVIQFVGLHLVIVSLGPCMGVFPIKSCSWASEPFIHEPVGCAVQ